MKKLTTQFGRFLKDEDGATMVEYGILVALISVVAIAFIAILGGYISGAFDEVNDQMGAAGIPAAAD